MLGGFPLTMQQNEIYVKAFGELIFVKNNQQFKPSDVLSKSLIHLLEFFVCHRNQVLPKEQLIDTLWSSNINPESALKFSIHRLRSILSKEDFFEEPLVVTTKNGYTINPDLDLKCDVDNVESLIQLSKQNNITVAKKLEYLSELVEIIDKPFLHNSIDLLWSNSIREYYKSIYNTSMITLMQHAHEQEKSNECLMLAQKAIQVDSLYEDHHYYYLMALIELKRYREAIEYYQGLISYFHKELQVSLSPKVKDLYTFVIKMEEKDHVDISGLMVELNEYHGEGSYYCDYEVFKRYYQIAKRLSDRNEASYYVVLIEIPDGYSHQESTDIMDDLIHAISSSLRKGDVFTRMNPKQCVILIPCEACNNIDSIVERVRNNYQKNAKMPFIKLKHHVSQLSKSK